MECNAMERYSSRQKRYYDKEAGKAEKEELEKDTLTEEHKKYVFNLNFEYTCEVENKVINKFDAYLKLIEEWFEKKIEKIDESLKE